MSKKFIEKAGIFVTVIDLVGYKVLPMVSNNANIFFQTKFHCLVFNVKCNEILDGFIETCSPKGLIVNLGFYKNFKILISNEYLPDGSIFHIDSNVWSSIESISLAPKQKIRFQILFVEENPKPIIVQGDANIQEIDEGQKSKEEESSQIIDDENDDQQEIDKVYAYGSLKHLILGPLRKFE
ncbi:DNA-directed RNA polymerase subunit E-like protein [Sarcoptes scabiei]|uniref:DNA-directed RNA polymerase subunit E-like protein n=1 Tax=Sarcoptes scabiei TaxID=52283 RepID=A0A132AEG7_SARSC|nr:DNA-directed RNA polymerase subunit E-like protein [Sarcoptes scabiei]